VGSKKSHMFVASDNSKAIREVADRNSRSQMPIAVDVVQVAYTVQNFIFKSYELDVVYV
jgi:hypothetical protein